MMFKNLPGLPATRQLAVLDDTLWQPLKGAVTRSAKQFGVSLDHAAGIFQKYLPTGKIGHRVQPDPASDTPREQVISERGAELVRQAGVDYESHLDWRNGCFRLPGRGAPLPVEVFWPDVEALICTKPNSERGRPTQEQVTAGVLRKLQDAASVGAPPPKREHELWPYVRDTMNGTDDQLREAMRSVPSHLKRARGKPSKPGA